MVNVNTNKTCLFSLVYFIAFMLYSPSCPAEIPGEYFLFPNVSPVLRSDLDNNTALDSSEIDYGVDLFGTVDHGKLRLLGEFLATQDGPDVERIAAGWLIGDNTVWLGRNHNPIGYWNTRYHHGTYLQNSISRPAIIDYEHDGGILPMHMGGLLVEGAAGRDGQGLGYELAVAVGPEFTGEDLDEWHLVKPASGERGITTTLNLYLEPVRYAPSRYGVYLNYTEIPASSIGVDEIRQISSGIYGNLEYPDRRLTAAAFYVHNHFVRSTGSAEDGFLSGYLQAEYLPRDKWTLFGRLEVTVADGNDAYLALFPNFVRDKVAAGVRIDITEHNSLKFELSGNHVMNDHYGQFMLQWDAMF